MTTQSIHGEDPRSVAERYFSLLGDGASPETMAALFDEDADFDIRGNEELVPWIGKRSGREGIAGFFADLNQMTTPIAFDVSRILVDDDLAVAIGALQTRVNATSKVIRSEFAIVMHIERGLITKYRLLEDSFAVSEALRF